MPIHIYIVRLRHSRCLRTFHGESYIIKIPTFPSSTNMDNNVDKKLKDLTTYLSIMSTGTCLLLISDADCFCFNATYKFSESFSYSDEMEWFIRVSVCLGVSTSY